MEFRPPQMLFVPRLEKSVMFLRRGLKNNVKKQKIKIIIGSKPLVNSAF